MRSPEVKTRSALRVLARDKSPLRDAFIGGNDTLIYKAVESFVFACNELFWKNANEGSYILKTVGVQALFDVLRKLAPGAVETKDLSVAYFQARLEPASALDFASQEFLVPAGKGRSIIRKAIEAKLEQAK
jgi:hypothetical protein